MLLATAPDDTEAVRAQRPTDEASRRLRGQGCRGRVSSATELIGQIGANFVNPATFGRTSISRFRQTETTMSVVVHALGQIVQLGSTGSLRKAQQCAIAENPFDLVPSPPPTYR